MAKVRISAKAIIIENGKLLTINHQGIDGNYYTLPGGGQKNVKSLTAAVQRECKEEADISVVPGDVLYIRDYIEDNHEFAGHHPGLHKVEIIFECKIVEGSKIGQGKHLDKGQIGVSWLPLDELEQLPFYPAALRKVLMKRSRENIYLGDVN